MNFGSKTIMYSAKRGIVLTGLFLCALLSGAQARLIIEDTDTHRSDSIIQPNTAAHKTDKVRKKRLDFNEKWSNDSLESKHNKTQADTAHLKAMNDSLLEASPKTLKLKTRFSPNPKRALWLSLVFPGAGQIYNRKYWKLPIIYGGFLGCTYALTWNQQMYRDYSQAYLDIMDDDPNTNSYLDMLPPRFDITGREEQFKKVFKRKKDFYRRNRDLSAFCFIGVYLLSVIDAYVDAQLSEFDITPDLSMSIEPAVIQNKNIGIARNSNSYGVGCSFKF